jgi:lipid II:glycine glycyltransferase (peptidoglycan interpeptide bridge formation enzyme)
LLIKSLDEINLNQEKFPIFFNDLWLDLQNELESRSKSYLYIDKRTKAIISFNLTKLKFLKKGNYNYIPLDFNGKEFDSQKEKEIIENFHKFLKGKCDVILPPQHIINFKSIPSKVIYYKLGILFIDLTKEMSEISMRMNSSYRSKIRQAQKKMVEVSFDKNNLSEFYKVYSEVYNLQNKSSEKILFFEKHINRLQEKIIVGLSKFCDNTESTIYCIVDSQNCYYEYGGTVDKPHFSGSNKLLFLSLMEKLKESNCQKLILGGFRDLVEDNSKIKGIQTFKLRLGAEIRDGYHFIKILNPWKYGIFNYLLKLKSIITRNEQSIINLNGLKILKQK